MAEPTRWRKKPVVIAAMRWDGTLSGAVEIVAWVNKEAVGQVEEARAVGDPIVIEILTLEGAIYASPGDWIIRGVAGEFYPCRNDIFEATYEAVE